MVMQPYFKATIVGQRPGDVIEIRATETAKLVASGIADSAGKFNAQYPASVGPVSATARRVLGAVDWIDDLDVAAGQILTSPNFGGKLLECRISGNTGPSAPTEADRMGEIYSRMWNSRYNTGVIYKMGPGDDDVRVKNYYTGTYDDDPKFDNWCTTWPLERVVEMVATQDGSYALLDDGSVRYTSRNSTSTSGGAYWEYTALSAWPKVVKLWEYQYGCVALGADGKLYAASARYGTASRYAIQNFIDANPTAVYFCGGGDSEDMATIILADGTIKSLDATIEAETAFITDAAIGKVNPGSNGDTNWIFVSQDGLTLYVKNRDAIVTYTDHIHPDNPGDRIARIQCGYGIVYFQMHSGRCGRWWGKAGVSTIKHGAQLGSYMHGKPTEIQLFCNQWGYNANLETDYLVTPKGIVNLTVGSGWSSGLGLSLDPNNGEKILIDGNPLVQNNDCIFALIDPPTEDLLRHQPVHLESIEVEGEGGADGEISGTLTIDGDPAARNLVAISASKQGSERTVVGHATSDASTGDYTMPLPGFIDPVVVIALDDSGTPWLPTAGVVHGQRMYPNDAAHTGLVYEAQGNGTTGATEPTWPLVAGDPITDGTVNWIAAEHYRGQVHGPVIPATAGEAGDNPAIVWETDVYLWAGLLQIEGVIFARYRKSTDQAVKLYRPVETPASFTDGLYLYEYEQTIIGADSNYNLFTSTIDSEDHRYRTLAGAPVTDLLPLPMALPVGNWAAGNLETHYIVTDVGWVGGYASNTLSPEVSISGGLIAYAGSADQYASMYARFALIDVIPGGQVGRQLRFSWWQASYAGSDAVRLEIRFLDDTDAEVGTATIGALTAPVARTWVLQTLDSAAIPADATQVEITWYAERFAGTSNNAYLDSYWCEVI